MSFIKAFVLFSLSMYTWHSWETPLAEGNIDIYGSNGNGNDGTVTDSDGYNVYSDEDKDPDSYSGPYDSYSDEDEDNYDSYDENWNC